MKSSIVFLGTGQGSQVVGRSRLSSGGFVLQVDENQFHVDPGPNTLMQSALCGINVRATNAIFVSHRHLHHCNDLNVLINAMTIHGVDKQGVLVGEESVVQGTEELPSILQDRCRNFLEKTLVLKPKQRIGINEIEIVALTTSHGDTPSIGFTFHTPYFSLGYTGDTALSEELMKELKGVHILIMNVPTLAKNSTKENLSVEETIDLITAVEPRLAILTHFGNSVLDADPLHQVREIHKATGIQTIAARDGMVINPLSYSVDKGQRTLIRGMQQL
ncbi:MAG: MBL fold metallo-hydrolase [Nanoarchaeota archaeon]|nr:MBL fold metallo-hydrolase [Nanoarchaeota archaeon]